MQPLYRALPCTVQVDGTAVPIRTDWRTAVRILCAFEDERLTAAEKQGVLLQGLYSTPPQNTAAAVTAGIAFLNGGLRGEGSGTRVYSLRYDTPYIAAAMQKSHGIDLQKERDMHWHRFLSLFMDLNEDCLFVRMVYLRTRRAEGRLTQEERRSWVQMQDILTLPTEQDAQSSAFMAELRQGAKTADEKEDYGRN